MNATNSDLSNTSRNELGNEVGLLRSTSETLQVGIILLSNGIWGGMWYFGWIGAIAFILGSLTTMGGLYWLAMRFGGSGSTLRLFEYGMELCMPGKVAVFRYDEVTKIAAKYIHHKMNHAYVSTKVQMEFEIEGRFQPYRYECDCRRESDKQRLVDFVLEQCSASVQRRLLHTLELQGEVAWTRNVYLTSNGLRLVDSGSENSRVIRFDQIEAVKMADNVLKIWKEGDAMPFLVLSNDTPNFVPLFDLFEKLTSCTHRALAEEVASVGVSGDSVPAETCHTFAG